MTLRSRYSILRIEDIESTLVATPHDYNLPNFIGSFNGDAMHNAVSTGTHHNDDEK